ncbi:hypothetical protein DPMN_109148 [Dreissena polymorpha]|uniref:Uncharacterized protein n=1 Tax=Dreissena polymorpha TaxID=45954 RepID=A0A9D4QMQ3_DREPO|nr:hypothetical protein DPMN_109148 [Dreissena polymorpha]
MPMAVLLQILKGQLYYVCLVEYIRTPIRKSPVDSSAIVVVKCDRYSSSAWSPSVVNVSPLIHGHLGGRMWLVFYRLNHNQLDDHSAALLSFRIVRRLSLPVDRAAVISRHKDCSQNPGAPISMANNKVRILFGCKLLEAL